MAATTSLFFTGLTDPVALQGSPQLVQYFRKHFSSWPAVILENERPARPLFTIQETKSGYKAIWGTTGATVFQRTIVQLLCDLGIDLAQSFVSLNPSLLCLHCSSVSIDGRLVVFPKGNRAGKSLLAACLLTRGKTLFADDLMAVTGKGEGQSFGLPPRLRLPLPPSFTRLNARLESLTTLDDGRYLFVYPHDNDIASFGSKQPIGAFIMPERNSRGKARLIPISPSQNLQHLAYQFQLPLGKAQMVFDTAKSLSCGPAWILKYSSVEEAAEVLLSHFERGAGFDAPSCRNDTPQSFFASAESSPTTNATLAERKRLAKRTVYYRRQKGGRVNRIGDCAYLIPKGHNEIIFLNPVALALWTLLEEPLNVAEAAKLLSSLYPDMPLAELENDIASLFWNLQDKGLISAK